MVTPITGENKGGGAGQDLGSPLDHWFYSFARSERARQRTKEKQGERG